MKKILLNIENALAQKATQNPNVPVVILSIGGAVLFGFIYSVISHL